MMYRLKQITDIGKAFFNGIRRGFRMYKNQIKYGSKWYILVFMVDMVLLPIKLLLVLPLAVLRPKCLLEFCEYITKIEMEFNNIERT